MCIKPLNKLIPRFNNASINISYDQHLVNTITTAIRLVVQFFCAQILLTEMMVNALSKLYKSILTPFTKIFLSWSRTQAANTLTHMHTLPWIAIKILLSFLALCKLAVIIFPKTTCTRSPAQHWRLTNINDIKLDHRQCSPNYYLHHPIVH